MGKKVVVSCLDVIIARKGRVNTERVPPGHPIILLKSNIFNMAAVSVQRSIANYYWRILVKTQFSGFRHAASRVSW